MPSPAAQNRRLYYRQPMHQRVDLRVAGMRVPVAATLIDISGGGCQLEATAVLKVDQAVEYDLPRPGYPLLRLPGKVRKVSYLTGNRNFRYAVEFDTLSEETRDSLLRFIIDEQRRAISAKTRPGEAASNNPPKSHTRMQEQRAHHRVEVNFPVRCTVSDSQNSFAATAIDVSTGGLRITSDIVLRQEWVINVRFTLPNEALRSMKHYKGAKEHGIESFKELRVAARPLPGVKESRGRYTQALSWLHPDPHVTDEISRFIQAMHAGSMRRH